MYWGDFMIIGISKNNKDGKEKIKKFLEGNYSFAYIDVDEILNDIIKQTNKKFDVEKDYFTIKNLVDKRINDIVSNRVDNNTIIIDYSLLEDLYIYDSCNLIFNVSNINHDVEENCLIKIKKYRDSIIDSKFDKKNIHLEINFDGDWEGQLRDFINTNICNDTLVTVVVPIHNTEDYLSRCVLSIMNQSYQNLEILLIDDGSTDNSLKLCNFFARKDKRIKVIHQENKGLAETRNKGLELANGEYISFIDSDDYIENDMISCLLKTIKEKNADVCEGSFYIHFRNGEIRDVTKEQKNNKFIETKYNLVNAYSDATILIPAWDKLYKRSAIKDIKFDKNCFKEDTDFIYKLCLAEKTFALVDKPFYHYIKRDKGSITADKLSPRLFSLRDWGWDAYNEVLAEGKEYQDAADKIIYNSLVHILRYVMRDYKNNVLDKDEYKDEIQKVSNELIELLLNAKNVQKFRKLEEVLDIINELTENNVIDKNKLPSIEIPCIGILWNSLNEEMMQEAMDIIKENSEVTGWVKVDLEEQYRQFINEIYLYNNEFEGIPVIKAGTLIDRYDSNSIMVLNMIIRVTNYIYFNKTKGFMYSEIAELKSYIRKYFKKKIRDYAYDNIFHLTVDDEEFQYTDYVCKKYIKSYNKRGNKNE